MEPTIERIEVTYLSSLYEDMMKQSPLLCGIRQLPGIKIGHLITDPPFVGVLMEEMGFTDILDESGIDFVIAENALPKLDLNYFIIPKSMGYVIKNYQGIRFAIFSKDRDSLTINEETKIVLIRQLSDVMWVIDQNFFEQPASKIEFLITNRTLADTVMRVVKTEADTTLTRKLKNFKSAFDDLLNRKTFCNNKRLDEYVLAQVAVNAEVDIIFYPENIFRKKEKRDSVSVRELLNDVAGETKFRKASDLTPQEIAELSKKYHLWQTGKKGKTVLVPDTNGDYLFDFLIFVEPRTEN